MRVHRTQDPALLGVNAELLMPNIIVKEPMRAIHPAEPDKASGKIDVESRFRLLGR